MIILIKMKHKIMKWPMWRHISPLPHYHNNDNNYYYKSYCICVFCIICIIYSVMPWQAFVVVFFSFLLSCFYDDRFAFCQLVLGHFGAVAAVSTTTTAFHILHIQMTCFFFVRTYIYIYISSWAISLFCVIASWAHAARIAFQWISDSNDMINACAFLLIY